MRDQHVESRAANREILRKRDTYYRISAGNNRQKHIALPGIRLPLN